MSNIPEFLTEILKKQYDIQTTNKIVAGYTKKKFVTLRANTLKSNIQKVENQLVQAKIDFEKVAWSNVAFIIKNASESEIRKLNIYENGEIYLQSLSSMLPAIILQPKEGENILDMTAAPGGKTTQIATLTNNKSYITACEMNTIRAERLKYNLQKQGVTNTFTMVTDSRKLDEMFSFDRILLDAPCSGSGTIFEEDTNLQKNFTIKLINKSTCTQYDLLKKAIKLLKVGKEMVYSTCSIISKENEEIISRILREEDVEIVPISFEGMEDIPILPTKIEGTMCICPNEYFEGFFIAKLKKVK